MSDIVLTLQGIERTFMQGGRALHVLRGCDLELAAGTTVGLIGPSGSGKSTLLQIAGLLEAPDAGALLINGVPVGKADERRRTLLRRNAIGFVYQFHHLLAEFSASENIMLPQMLAGVPREDARRRSLDLLSQVGLTARAEHRPARLSGGEQQRVALARALANRPSILIADEPTGNLDPETADQVFSVVSEMAQSANLALLMATHNHDLAKRLERVVEIKDGRVVELAQSQ